MAVKGFWLGFYDVGENSGGISNRSNTEEVTSCPLAAIIPCTLSLGVEFWYSWKIENMAGKGWRRGWWDGIGIKRKLDWS